MKRNMYDAVIKAQFGEIVHKSRTEKGITQEGLSELAGITDVYLRNLEVGSCTATWVIWLRICTILNIDVPAFQEKYIEPGLQRSKAIEMHHTLNNRNRNKF